MQFKIIHFSDVHLSPLGHIPQSRTDSYHADVRNEINLLKMALINEQPDILIFSGDLFHLKNQSAYSPKDLNYYTHLFQDFPPFYSIPGNHDLPKSAYINLQDSPYYTLAKSLPSIIKDISLLQANIPLPFTSFKNLRLFGVPYVPIASFLGGIQQFIDNFHLQDSTDLHGFLIHIDAMPQPLAIKLWESFVFSDLAQAFPKNSLLFLGHIHHSFSPFYDLDKNVFISKPWSIARVIKDYFNQTDVLEHQHTPSYSKIILEETPQGLKTSITYHPIPGIKPSTEIFQMQSLKIQLEKSKEIQDLIQSLKNQVSDAKSSFFLNDPMLYLKQLNLQKEIFDLIVEYINEEKET